MQYFKNQKLQSRFPLLSIMMVVFLLSSCSTTGSSKNDPLEPMNRAIFEFNEVVDDNIFGDQWISKVVGTTKTKAEAQAIVDGEIEDAQDAWDANNVDGESSDEKIARLGAKPVKYNLP